jgi:hypothetical protein
MTTHKYISAEYLGPARPNSGKVLKPWHIHYYRARDKWGRLWTGTAFFTTEKEANEWAESINTTNRRHS